MPARTPRALLVLVVLALSASGLATSVAASGPRVEIATGAAIAAADGHLVAIIRSGGRTTLRTATAARGQERATALRLAELPGVVAVVPDVVTRVTDWPATGAPNDPSYGSQGDLPQAGVPAAWRETLGAGAVVAVLDTGANLAHPDLAGLDVRGTYNAFDGTANVADGHGHGTHTLGTIAAQANNGIGVAGIAPGAGFLVVKVLGDTGSGSFSALMNGIEWAIAHGATVLSMSLGTNSDPTTMQWWQYGTDDAYRAGVTSVAAAGNAGSTALAFPASYPHVISVGSVGPTNAHSWFSQSNAWVDMAAPGESTLSLSRTGGYATMSGTSMATPHVAGAVALLQAAVPGMAPDAVEAALAVSAVDLGPAGRDDAYGDGLLDAGGAIAAARAGDLPPAPTPRPTPAPGSSASPSPTVPPSPSPLPTPPVDTTKPVVTAHAPAGTLATLDGVVVSATWSEAIANPASIGFTLTASAPGLQARTIAGTKAYGILTRTITFTPAAPLVRGPVYTARLTGATDAAGNRADPVSWTFTGPLDATPPAVLARTPAGAGGTLATAAPEVRFDEPLGDSGATAGVVVTSAAPGLETRSWDGTVVYDAASFALRFTPSTPFTPGPEYTVTVTNVRDRAGNLAPPVTWTFSGEPDTTPPSVVAVTPTGDGVALPAAPSIRATFDEPLGDAGRTATVTVTGGGPDLPATTVAGRVTYDAATTTLVFAPAAPIPFGPRYTVRVTGARDRAGNLAQPLAWTFAGPPDTRAPQVSSSAPAGTGVTPSSTIRVTFDEALLRPTTLTTVTVVSRPLGAAPETPATVVPGSLTWVASTRTLVFTPVLPPLPGAAWTATVHGARDASGNLVPDTSWSWEGPPVDTTAPLVTATSPAAGASVPLAAPQVVVRFSEPVMAARVTVQSVSATGVVRTIAGTLAWNRARTGVRFTPSSALRAGTRVRVTVSGAVDPSGNTMARVRWSFRTVQP